MRLLVAASQASHTDGVQARDEHPARIDDAAVADIGTEREFMDALRLLKARSGLSYRDIAVRMSRVAPRQAMAKSTLATLFAQDTLPRRPGQLTAIVDVLAQELTESADLAARYLAAWTRLMTARSARAGGTAGASQRVEQASPPAMPAVVPVPSPVPPQARYRAPLYYQPAYREPCVPAAIHAQAEGEFGPAGGFLTLLVGGLILSVITWLPFMHSGFSFWLIWLCWGGPILPLLALVPGRSRVSSSDELPAEYVRYEHLRATERVSSTPLMKQPPAVLPPRGASSAL
jgi:hypothetical protein